MSQRPGPEDTNSLIHPVLVLRRAFRLSVMPAGVLLDDLAPAAPAALFAEEPPSKPPEPRPSSLALELPFVGSISTQDEAVAAIGSCEKWTLLELSTKSLWFIAKDVECAVCSTTSSSPATVRLWCETSTDQRCGKKEEKEKEKEKKKIKV